MLCSLRVEKDAVAGEASKDASHDRSAVVHSYGVAHLSQLDDDRKHHDRSAIKQF